MHVIMFVDFINMVSFTALPLGIEVYLKFICSKSIEDNFLRKRKLNGCF